MKFGKFAYLLLGTTLIGLNQASQLEELFTLVYLPQKQTEEPEVQPKIEASQNDNTPRGSIVIILESGFEISLREAYVSSTTSQSSHSSSSTAASISASSSSCISTGPVLTGLTGGYPLKESRLSNISISPLITFSRALDFELSSIRDIITTDGTNPTIVQHLKIPKATIWNKEFSNWNFRKYWSNGSLNFEFRVDPEDEEMIGLVVINNTEIEFGLSLTFTVAEDDMLKHRNFRPKRILQPVKTFLPPKKTTMKQFYSKEIILKMMKNGHFLYAVGNMVPVEELEKMRNASTTPKPLPKLEPKKSPRRREKTKSRSSRERIRYVPDRSLYSMGVGRTIIRLWHREYSPYTALSYIPFTGLSNEPKDTWANVEFEFTDADKNKWLFKFAAKKRRIKVYITPCPRKDFKPADVLVNLALVASRDAFGFEDRLEEMLMIHEDMAVVNTAEPPVTLKLCSAKHFHRKMFSTSANLYAYCAIGIHLVEKFDVEFARTLPTKIKFIIMEYLLEEHESMSSGRLRTRSLSPILHTRHTPTSIQRRYSDGDLQNAELLNLTAPLLELFNEKSKRESDENEFPIAVTELGDAEES